MIRKRSSPLGLPICGTQLSKQLYETSESWPKSATELSENMNSLQEDMSTLYNKGLLSAILKAFGMIPKVWEMTIEWRNHSLLVELLLQAASDANIEQVKVLLKQGVQPDVADEDFITALQIAASQGNLKLMQLLLDHGASVDKCSDLGFTPFLHACRNGHLEAVELLLKYNADSRRSTFYGTNALTLAAAGGHHEIVLRLQGLCDMPQGYAPSPLVVAAAERHFDLVAFFKLLKNAPLWHKRSGFYGISAEEVAEILKDWEMSEFLFDLDKFIEQTKHNNLKKADRTLLLPDIRCLMHERKVYQAQRLLASGRESVSLPLGTTPLMFAAIVGDLRMVKMLVQGGADISASVFGFNALTIAVACGNDAVVRYLYKASPVKCEETFQTAKKLIRFSNGIHPNTVDLVFHGKNTLKKKRNLFSKCPKILGRKKVQVSNINCIDAAFGDRLAFSERVASALGPYSSRVPLQLLKLLTCPHDVSKNECFQTRNAEQQDAVEVKGFRIMDLFGSNQIQALFRKLDDDSAYFPYYGFEKYSLTKRHSVNQAEFDGHCKISTRQLDSASNVKQDCQLLHVFSNSRLNRNISNLQRAMFRFKSSSDRDMSTKTEEWNPKESAKQSDECWQRIADDCGDEVCKVLNEEGIDFESFLLLRRDDFEEMFLDNACVDTLEGIQESFNRGRVVYL